MAKYIAKVACIHRNRMYEEDEILITKKNEKVPHHFELVKTRKEREEKAEQDAQEDATEDMLK